MNRQSKNEIIAEANIISHGEIITRRSFSKILKGAGIGLFLFVFSGFCSVALAQTGSISGTVADDNSGEIIQGEVKLLNSNTEAASSGGAFDFTGLAEGDYTLLVNSPGYYSRAIEINLSADEKIEQIIGLAGVSANEQRALNFSNTLSTERTNDFGDYSIKEALVRVPGIQVSREGEINIRGTGFDSYNVTLNGQRLANTGFENRSFDLASISVDAIRKLEVIKVLTPDMDADALGGVINLHTTQLAGKERKLSARLGGGANTQYLSRNGPGNRAWLNYSEKFQENISVALNLSYQEDQQGWEELNLSYGLADFGSGLVDVVEQISPSLHMDNRGRFGSTVSVSYDPAEEESYFFRAMVATDNRENVSHANNWLAQGDWVDQLTTGAEGELGTYSHDARQQSTDITQATFQAGGEHQLETLDISYSAGWSQSIVDRAEHLFPFEIGGFDYAIDWSDRARPSMTVTNRPTQIMEDGSVDRRFMIGQEFERTLEEHVNNEISARVDVNYPIGLGSLKAGVSTRLSIKDGEYDENFFTYNRTLRMVSFNMLREPNRNIDIIGNDYTIPWLVNTGDARSFFDNQRPVFSGDDNLNRSRSEIRNYHSSEHINAGYGMATFEFGKLSVIGGARLELAYAEYTGNQVTFDDGGDFIESNEVIDSGNDLRIFPNAQFIFDATENSSAKLAYTRTMARPNYIALTPFERVNHFDSTIFRGNPQLDPVTSDNLDLMLEYSFDNNAHISVGGFYKELSDFV
ncbi:MAG: outer membrane beta-barrel protein, partial [Balneolaceae bacterium]